MAPEGKGPNVNILQIAEGKVGTVWNRGYAHQTEAYVRGSRR